MTTQKQVKVANCGIRRKQSLLKQLTNPDGGEMEMNKNPTIIYESFIMELAIRKIAETDPDAKFVGKEFANMPYSNS